MKKLLFVMMISILSQTTKANELRSVTDAQDVPVQEMQEAIDIQVKQKLNAFLDHLYKISSKEVDYNNKDFYIESCLDLIVGRGNATKDEYENIVIQAPKTSIIESNLPVRTYPTKTVLQRFKNYPLFRVTKIKSATVYIFEKKDNYSIVTCRVYSTNQYNKIEYQGTNKSYKIPLKSTDYDMGTLCVKLGDIEMEVKDIH